MSAALLALALCTGATAAPGDFDAIVALQASGRAREALALAEASEDPLLRAQGELYVRYQSGDLAGAFAAGLRGLEQYPKDLWLLERSATLAASLGSSERAAALAAKLVSAAAANTDLSADDRARWEAAGTAANSEAANLGMAAERRRAALGAARTTVLAFAAGAVVAFGWLARERRPGE